MFNIADIVIVGCSILFGMTAGVVLVRYGIRVGNRLTIAAQNNEPMDMEPMPDILQERSH